MADSNWSVPEQDVIDTARRVIETDVSAVLATIVDVEGSAYRRPGAKMVIPDDGQSIGSITAGCLEDEVYDLAQDVLADGSSRVESYDLTGDDDVWGLGVGCNGVIDVLLEPLGEDYRPVTEAVTVNAHMAVCTVLRSDDPAVAVGDRVYFDRDGSNVCGDAWPERLANEIHEPAVQLAESGNAQTVTVETFYGENDVFIDGVSPPPELVVLGTGHDVGPVVELAKKNDFQVTVVGFRGVATTPERFPHADRVRTSSPASLQENHEFDQDTYVVVMSHNFVDDRLALDELLATPVPYIGLMGPRKRFQEMQEEFAKEGRRFSPEELDRIYTPAGLNLGGGTPYQIAHSIIAEVLAVHNDRTPQHLKSRKGHIHDRVKATES